MLEEQAVGRCWRMGQECPVVIKRLYVENSIEANILKLLRLRMSSANISGSQDPPTGQEGTEGVLGFCNCTFYIGCPCNTACVHLQVKPSWRQSCRGHQERSEPFFSRSNFLHWEVHRKGSEDRIGGYSHCTHRRCYNWTYICCTLRLPHRW